MAAKSRASDERWHCPDCSGWVRADVDAHYCNAPVVVTVPVYQPYPVYYPPYVVYPNTTWPLTQITCVAGSISTADTTQYLINAA